VSLLTKESLKAQQVISLRDTREPGRTIFIKHHVKVSLLVSATIDIPREQVRSQGREEMKALVVTPPERLRLRFVQEERVGDQRVDETSCLLQDSLDFLDTVSAVDEHVSALARLNVLQQLD
jgi:hypothetical protein